MYSKDMLRSLLAAAAVAHLAASAPIMEANAPREALGGGSGGTLGALSAGASVLGGLSSVGNLLHNIEGGASSAPSTSTTAQPQCGFFKKLIHDCPTATQAPPVAQTPSPLPVGVAPSDATPSPMPVKRQASSIAGEEAGEAGEAGLAGEISSSGEEGGETSTGGSDDGSESGGGPSLGTLAQGASGVGRLIQGTSGRPNAGASSCKWYKKLLSDCPRSTPAPLPTPVPSPSSSPTATPDIPVNFPHKARAAAW